MKTTRMGRPPKTPEERRDQGLRIPLTDAEKALVEQLAQADSKKAGHLGAESVVASSHAEITVVLSGELGLRSHPVGRIPPAVHNAAAPPSRGPFSSALKITVGRAKPDLVNFCSP